MKKKLLVLLMCIAMVGMFAACGGGSSDSGDSGDTSSSDASGAITINIWDNNQLEGLQKIADEWSEKSGVKVQMNVITWGEYWTLLEAGASGGELPDVFWMHINEAQKYMRSEKLLNLNDYIAADDNIDSRSFAQSADNR